MNVGPLLLIIVLVTTIVINYVNNRCPNCKKWKITGFNRSDEEDNRGENITVYCQKCSYKWQIKYKEPEIKPKNNK